VERAAWRGCRVNYLEWSERVFDVALALDDGVMGYTSCMAIAERLGFGEATWDDFSRRDDPRLEGLIDAITDLSDVGIEMPNIAQVRITHRARDVRHAGFRAALYPYAFGPVLDSEASLLIKTLVERSVDAGTDYARLVEQPLGDVWEAVNGGAEDHTAIIRSIGLARSLAEKGLVRGRWAGQSPPIWPTLLGVIRATQAGDLEWQQRIVDLLADWETTSVEFKREMDLDTDAGKRRLVRSVLALATTKASGPRYLVIGFDSQTHAFTTPVDARLTSDRIEDVLAAYTDPVPEIRYRTVRLSGGDAGIVEVLRDAAKVPYRVKQAMKGLAVRDVVVRHGSHIEPPTAGELEALLREAALARGEPAASAEGEVE
jgi:hypothetical protein